MNFNKNTIDARTSELAMSKNIASLRGINNNYLKWNLSLFPMKKGQNILDLGCGAGFYYHDIMAYRPSLYYGADSSEIFLKEVIRLSDGRANSKTMLLDLLDPAAPERFRGIVFHAILCFDVLEHIKDDRKALKNIRSIIEATGKGMLFLRVPALQMIYGQNDLAIGHYRRYSRELLKKLMEECGFRVERSGYQNIFGIIPWWIIGRLLKRDLAVSAEEGRFFNSLVPLLQRMEHVFPPPVGLSLYCISRIVE